MLQNQACDIGMLQVDDDHDPEKRRTDQKSLQAFAHNPRQANKRLEHDQENGLHQIGKQIRDPFQQIARFLRISVHSVSSKPKLSIPRIFHNIQPIHSNC